ncbi:hypothetical protein [Brachyspira intermedia]|uniref:hypothetical protein n=1 Tax=Brachyspira intermedia TaxID=84377 RepID=UPI00300718E5
MGFFDLVKSGAEKVGKMAKDFNDDVKKYEVEYSRCSDQQLMKMLNNYSGARKVAVAKILKSRGYGPKN